MSRFLFTLGLVVAVSAAVVAAPVPADSEPAKDREGNPLPKGATARLGSHVFCGATPYGFTFSPDSKRIIGIGWYNFIGWDVATGKRLSKRESPLFSIKTERPAQLSGNHFVRFENALGGRGSDDEATKTTITLTDTDGKKLSQFDFKGVYGAQDIHTITPDGKRFIFTPATSNKSRQVYVFELPNAKLLHTFEVDNSINHGGRVFVSPDSKTLFIPQSFNPLRRFDLDSGKELSGLKSGEEFPNNIIVSPDNKTSVSICQPGFTTPFPNFWAFHDLVDGKEIGKLEFRSKHRPSPCTFVCPRAVIAFSVVQPSGYLPQMYTISRWNLDTMKCEWDVPAPIGWPILSPDGKRLASSSGAHICLYDSATGKRIDSATGHVNPVNWIGFSRDGQTVTTTGSREVMKWSLNGERKSSSEPPELRDRWAYVTDSVSPLVWVRSADGGEGKKWEVVSWDFEEDKIAWRMPLETDQRTNPINLLSHDGKQVIVSSRNDDTQTADVIVYDGPAGKKLHSWTLKKSQGIYRLSADGKTLFIRDGALAFAGLDVATGKETMRTKFEVDNRAGTLSPDGSRVARTWQRDRYSPAALVVYDTKTSKEIANIELGMVRTDTMVLMFSPHGKQVAMRTETDVLVCDVENDAKPRKLDTDSTWPTCMAFSPNCASLAVGYEDGTSLIWDLTSK